MGLWVFLRKRFARPSFLSSDCGGISAGGMLSNGSTVHESSMVRLLCSRWRKLTRTGPEEDGIGYGGGSDSGMGGEGNSFAGMGLSGSEAVLEESLSLKKSIRASMQMRESVIDSSRENVTVLKKGVEDVWESHLLRRSRCSPKIELQLAFRCQSVRSDLLRR